MATLYRKYRSRTFDEVIGQAPIVTTLKNQIKLGRIGHAYLFAGSRGVGKTSCARIFARAVNCLHPVDGSPCGECEVCKKLDSPDNVDIIEMDAASNNGVDDARDIREKVKYAPAVGKYKVYIIDEVHMLTGGAFNALLKTIEEPPEHVIFILATTEPQKLPQTILSRCIRFDFKLVSTDELAKHIAAVYDREGISYTKEATEEIARQGEGSVRDALSIADMLGSAAEKITPEVVLSLTGAGDSSRIAELFDCAAARDVAGCLAAIDALAKSGKSMSAVCRQLNIYARNALVLKAVGKDRALSDGLINADRAAFDSLCVSADKCALGDIARLLDRFGAAESGLKYSVSPRLYLETSIVGIVCGADEDDDLRKRVSALERKLGSVAPAPEQKKNNPITPSAPVTEQPKQPQPQVNAPAASATPPEKPSAQPITPPAARVTPQAPAAYDYDVPPPPPPEYYGAADGIAPRAREVSANAMAKPAQIRTDKQREASTAKLPEYVSADEGEFMHRRGIAVTGLELLGKVATYLRKKNDMSSARVRDLLSRGVKVKEREDAIAFVVPDACFLQMSEAATLDVLNAALDHIGQKKRARVEKSEDDLYADDLELARELFGRDHVKPKGVGNHV